MKGALSISLVLVASAVCMVVIGCKEGSSEALAPYAGHRAMFITQITQSSAPDLSWLGGRVAAVGVNRGVKPALDTSLVWLRTSTVDTMSSYQPIDNTRMDKAAIISYGGTPADSLENGQLYVFWVATRVAYDAKLDTTKFAVNATSLASDTLTPFYWLRGQWGGQQDRQGNLAYVMRMRRWEQATSATYTIFWSPATAAFRRMGVTEGALGAFTNNVWAVTTPDSLTDNILPPVTIGVVPPNTIESTAWAGFKHDGSTVYTVWVANSRWAAGNFSPKASGYAWFRPYAF